MNRRFEFDEELIRKYLSLVDLEEFKLREKWLDNEDMEAPLVLSCIAHLTLR